MTDPELDLVEHLIVDHIWTRRAAAEFPRLEAAHLAEHDNPMLAGVLGHWHPAVVAAQDPSHSPEPTEA